MLSRQPRIYEFLPCTFLTLVLQTLHFAGEVTGYPSWKLPALLAILALLHGKLIESFKAQVIFTGQQILVLLLNTLKQKVADK